MNTSFENNDMKVIPVALVGFGKMGKNLLELSTQYGIKVVEIFSENEPLHESRLDGWDVAIDFTHPSSVVNNITFLSKHSKNIVVGTTGWSSSLPIISEIVQNSKIGCVYGSNFSVGVNVFLQVIKKASELLQKETGYDVALWEAHHTGKADSPSGTAESLAKVITQHRPDKQSILRETSHGSIESAQLHSGSLRVGFVPGTHTVIFDSVADTLELTHRARNREGFAQGALLAARWISNKKGMFEFSEIFYELLLK